MERRIMQGALDADSRAFLDRVAAAGREVLDHRDLPSLRASTAAMMAAFSPEAPPVGDYQERVVVAAGRSIPIRVYWPPKEHSARARDLPALLYLHGGAWTHFSAATHDPVARYLCAAGKCVVVNVDYRLAPEHPFPAGLDDAFAALRWLEEHCEDLGVAAHKIAVAGESAGGNLCVGVCLMARQRGGPKIALQVPMCASFTLDALTDHPSWTRLGGGDYLISRAAIEQIKSLYLRDPAEAKNPLVSPLLADLGGLPPALLISAQFDPLVDEAACYAERLRAAGVPVDHQCFAGTIHSFMILARAIPLGYRALDVVAQRIAALA